MNESELTTLLSRATEGLSPDVEALVAGGAARGRRTLRRRRTAAGVGVAALAVTAWALPTAWPDGSGSTTATDAAASVEPSSTPATPAPKKPQGWSTSATNMSTTDRDAALLACTPALEAAPPASSFGAGGTRSLDSATPPAGSSSRSPQDFELVAAEADGPWGALLYASKVDATEVACEVRQRADGTFEEVFSTYGGAVSPSGSGQHLTSWEWAFDIDTEGPVNAAVIGGVSDDVDRVELAVGDLSVEAEIVGHRALVWIPTKETPTLAEFDNAVATAYAADGTVLDTVKAYALNP